jgi:raffinose/stachyose/melibiose transport system permease protein
MPEMWFQNPRRVWRVASGLLIALLFLVPVLYVIMISLEPPGQFVAHPMLPGVPTVQNFSSAWQQSDLGPEVVNTIIYSLCAAAAATALSLVIAFPIARKLVGWSSSLYKAFVIGIALPLPIIPLFIEARELHLYDNRLGYIVLHVEPGLPLGVLLITAMVSAIPRELDEAALLDGTGYVRYLVTVVAPLAWPSMVITFLYSLLGVWNDIIGPVVLLSTPSLFPVTRGVYSFYGANPTAYTLLAAAIVIVSLPVVLLFVVSQRQLFRGTLGLSA